MNILNKVILFAAIAFATTTEANAEVKVRAQADSSTIIMGDRAAVNVVVLTSDVRGKLVLPQKEEDYHGMELADCHIDTADTGNGTSRITYRLMMQAFEPQVVTLPGFEYVLDGDTTKSNPLTFKVLPVELSPELGNPEDVENLTIHPEESVTSIPSKWYDFIPGWTLWALLGIVLVALGVILYLLYKKNGPSIFTPRKPEPPYDMAIRRLEALKSSGMINSATPKVYFTELTDILRQYIDGRFGINAMEMTSTEILRRLRENLETRLTAEQIRQVLSLADFVKFAAANPPKEDSMKMYNTVFAFVQSTRPAPEPEAENDRKK